MPMRRVTIDLLQKSLTPPTPPRLRGYGVHISLLTIAPQAFDPPNPPF